MGKILIKNGRVDAQMHIRVRAVDKYGTPAELSCFPFGVTAAADTGAACGWTNIYKEHGL